MFNFNRSPCVSRKALNPASPYDPTTPINAVKWGQFTIPIIKTDHVVCIESFSRGVNNYYKMNSVNQLVEDMHVSESCCRSLKPFIRTGNCRECHLQFK